MKTIIQVLIVILALVGLYLAIMAFSSWLVVILFNIWAVQLPFIKVLQSMILITILYAIMFSSSKQMSQ